jgi:hypothetical protein
VPNNENYNHNEHDDSDNNNQSNSTVHGGEFRNGRLSQIKNHNPKEKAIPNEYLNEKEEEEEEDLS